MANLTNTNTNISTDTGRTSTSTLPMSNKQKDMLAQARIIKKHGQAFYKLNLTERYNLRIAELLLIDQEESDKQQEQQQQEAQVITKEEHNNNYPIHALLGIDPIKEVREIQDVTNKNEAQGIQEQTKTNAPQEQVIQTRKKFNFYSIPEKPTTTSPSDSFETSILPHESLQPSDQFKEKFSKAESLTPEASPYSEKPLSEGDGSLSHAGKRKHETFALNLVLNAKQTLAAEYAEQGKSFVLTGPAGTGKTTGCREIAKRLLAKGMLSEHDFKLPGGERTWGPSIAICSFTNRATDNIRRALHKDPELEEVLVHNVLTIHKLLEYEPEYFDIQDEETGEWRTTMRFNPKRTSKNPLRITHLIIEESSMLGTDLGLKLMDALPRGCQIIYVGDINQLPPIMTKSMLNYALILLPVVELNEVYRQALESPILSNAHLCLQGKPLEDKRPFFQVVSGKLLSTIPTESKCVNNLVNSLRSWYEIIEEDGSKKYDPEQDIVLSPWNKQECGTVILNAHIAQFIGKNRKALVYEVYAGMRKLYIAVGDRVMINKQDGIITKISHNGRYLSRMPRPASTEMTRFGMVMVGNREAEYEDLEASFTNYASLNVDEIDEKDLSEKKQEASHVVEVKLENGAVEVLHAIGEFSDSNFSLGYALTIHKAQGCEWRKVFILIHRAHAISLNREMLYTAITRAREYCIVVDLCNMLERTIANQRIKGNSVEEKIEWFNSEISLAEPIPVIPYLENKPIGDPVIRPASKPKDKFVPFISQYTPVTLIRLADFVPQAFKDDANAQLYKRWAFAQTIWGDKIGNIPYLSYDLQKRNTIGLAKLGANTIKLNPLWCILGVSDPKVREEMLGDTLDHEIAHFVSYRFSNDRGHDSGWRMAMKLMGREPNVFATEGTLPSWTENYKDIVEKIKQELASKNAMLDDDYVADNMDQV